MEQDKNNIDVAICGAGPVGLALAALLAHRGIEGKRIALIDARALGQSISDPRSIALDCGPSNVRANTISTGSIATEMLLDAARRHPLGDKALEAHRQANPLGRLGEPSEIANTCVFLLSDEAPYISGGDFKVDGGRTART